MIEGGAGDDVIAAAAGDDVIDAGEGDDKLAGGDGSDTLTGGAGQDTFIFDGEIGLGGIDEVTDFNPSEDKIDLSGLVSLDIEQESIGDYITVSEDEGNTVITVHPNGLGPNDPDSEPVAVLNDVIGLGSAQDMISNEQMIVDQA